MTLDTIQLFILTGTSSEGFLQYKSHVGYNNCDLEVVSGITLQLQQFANGVEYLTDKELLSFIIGNTQVAESLLSRYTDIHDLSLREAQEFYPIRGIGPFKARRLHAVFELSRRLSSRPLELKLKITGPESIFSFYEPRLSHLTREVFFTLILNSANRLLGQVKVSEGILNASLVHPREVFRVAILESAASIILLHNHPSGEVSPSCDDKKITRRIVEAGLLMDIPVLDHVIIGQKRYFSFREQGLLGN